MRLKFEIPKLRQMLVTIARKFSYNCIIINVIHKILLALYFEGKWGSMSWDNSAKKFSSRLLSCLFKMSQNKLLRTKLMTRMVRLMIKWILSTSRPVLLRQQNKPNQWRLTPMTNITQHSIFVYYEPSNRSCKLLYAGIKQSVALKYLEVNTYCGTTFWLFSIY